MIEIGISGCDNLRAAELVRVLINHPDVELKWVTGKCDAGTRLDHIVPGIMGESDLTVNSEGPLGDVDLVFMCGCRDKFQQQFLSLDLKEDTKVVDLSGYHNLDHGADKPWTYGLGEMQRRILVHDANLVTLPGNAAIASLLALMPMARNLLLNSPISLHVAMGATAFPEADGKTTDGYDVAQWTKEQQQEIDLALHQCQTSFDQPIDLTITPLAEKRTLAVEARINCGIDEEMVRQLYEQYYSDHNFVFLVDRPIVPADVENTNKCLIRLEKDERKGLLTIHAMMDVLLKGCAGTAVHAMNLLFGLHERVGLTLKATGC